MDAYSYPNVIRYSPSRLQLPYLSTYEKEKKMIDTKKGAELSNEHENKNMTKEVIIYESGNPVLKVETGTTLKVIKLLYETQYEKKKDQILGVRPKKFEEGIPCIITMNESKLNEISYDILVSDEGEDRTSESVQDEKTTTNRCIDCSRESWKTKRFTSIGMNTEISINPFTDVDVAKLKSKDPQILQQHQQINNSSNPIEKHRNGSVPHSQQQTQVSSTVAFSNQATSEYVASLPTPIHNGKRHELENDHARASPSPTYGLDAYNNHMHPSQIMHHTRPGIDSMHYDHFAPSHVWSVGHSRYAHGRSIHGSHSPDARKSPTRRSRSPLSPRQIDIREGYAAQFHGIREKHLLMLHSPRHEHRMRRDKQHSPVRYDRFEDGHHRDKVFLRKERDSLPNLPEYRREEKHHRPLQPAEEPPVFVLPNDYDIVSGIDPRVAGMQERRMVKSPMIEKEQEAVKTNPETTNPVNIKEEVRNIQNKSNGSASPKSGEDIQDPRTNSLQKLYCKICNSVFPTKSLLYKHLRGHTSDEKPFKCSECGQGFTLSSNLRQHRIIHRGYKPFQCEFCGKKFMRSNVYKQHRRIHTGEEMHKCGLCPSEFLQKYALLKHMKKNHDIDAVDN